MKKSVWELRKDEVAILKDLGRYRWLEDVGKYRPMLGKVLHRVLVKIDDPTKRQMYFFNVDVEVEE